MQGSFEIRFADPADAPALASFAARQFRATYQDDTPEADLEAYIRKSFGPDQQEQEISDRAAAVLLVTTEDRLIGYAHLLGDADDIGRAFLNRIYIDEAWRGKGVARALLDAIVEEARRRDAGRLELTVFERNGRAISFYNKAGFEIVGSTVFKVGDDLQTDFVMQKRLML